MASNTTVVSVHTCRTSLSSILKPYSTLKRDKVKRSLINKVRFELPKEKGVVEAIKQVQENQNYALIGEFVAFLNENQVDDVEMLQIVTDAHAMINLLSPKFTALVEALMARLCLNISEKLLTAFNEFYLDILVAHNCYLSYGITRLIQLWIPPSFECDKEPGDHILNIHDLLSVEWKSKCLMVHDLLERILSAIPLAFTPILDAIESQFPYFKKSPYLIVGYIYNLMIFLERKPMFTESIMQIIISRLVLMDVHAPRHEIEDCETENENSYSNADYDHAEMNKEGLKKIHKAKEDNAISCMTHPVAKTLDFCLLEMYQFFNMKNVTLSALDNSNVGQVNGLKFLKVLIKTFDAVILPVHDPHHVQFLMFYFSNLRICYAKIFLSNLWEKIKNLNTSAVIRQAAVSYMASFLARSKLIGLNILQHYLSELCHWCHQYIKYSDQQCSLNNSLKAHVVFYAMCQAIFYIVAFRSSDLTKDKKGLLFLQSLQLPALVTCNLNPLRVCLPAVATKFARVTRAYQLAYCHTILERNVRRKLAVVYGHGRATPEETMDTFFPFDPYLLRLSSKFIKPHYVEYKVSEGEEFSVIHHQNNTKNYSDNLRIRSKKRSKRHLSTNQDDNLKDMDDFLLSKTSKRQKCTTVGTMAVTTTAMVTPAATTIATAGGDTKKKKK